MQRPPYNSQVEIPLHPRSRYYSLIASSSISQVKRTHHERQLQLATSWSSWLALFSMIESLSAQLITRIEAFGFYGLMVRNCYQYGNELQL